MNGCIDGQVGGWTGRQVGGWMNGWVCRQMIDGEESHTDTLVCVQRKMVNIAKGLGTREVLI